MAGQSSRWITTARLLRRTGFGTTGTQVDEQLTELSNWWLRRMAAVHQPVHEKLTLLWHNRFATSAEKVRSIRSPTGC